MTGLVRGFGKVAAVALGFTLLGAWPAAAQVPPVPTETPCVPGLTCPTETEPTPSESPTASPSPSPSQDPSASPTPTPEPSPTVEPSPASEPVTPPSFGPLPLQPIDVTTTAPGDGQAPAIAPLGGSGGQGASGTVYALLVATDRDIAQALTGSAVLIFLAATIATMVFGGTYRLTRHGVLTARQPDGGIDVDTTRKWRTWAGLGTFVVSGIVAVVGFVRIAGEPLVPIQLVYLASTGLAVVILAAIGGALLVSEQLRSDEHRLQEIEQSLAIIASHVAAGVSDPPRLLDRGTSAEDAGDESV